MADDHRPELNLPGGSGQSPPRTSGRRRRPQQLSKPEEATPPPPLRRRAFAWISWLWWKTWAGLRWLLGHLSAKIIFGAIVVLLATLLGWRWNLEANNDKWRFEFWKPSPPPASQPSPWEPKVQKAK